MKRLHVEQEWDRLIEQLELLQDVHQANNQIAAGKAVPEKKAHTALLAASVNSVDIDL